MRKITKRLAAVGVTTLAVTGLATATAGTAGAATCRYNPDRDAIISVGPLHAGTAKGDCGWLKPGAGLRGERGWSNTISLGAVPTGQGTYLVGFIDDPTGLWPTDIDLRD